MGGTGDCGCDNKSTVSYTHLDVYKRQELTSEEIFWLNGYTAETSQVVGRQTHTLDENSPGVHNLDGIDVYKRQDEDKVSGDLSEHMDPNFKPDWSPDLFYSHNYITHFFVVKKEIIDKIGGFRSEYDGSKDYDLMFRCIEKDVYTRQDI